jgi:hypothetical protein
VVNRRLPKHEAPASTEVNPLISLESWKEQRPNLVTGLPRNRITNVYYDYSRMKHTVRFDMMV